MTTSETLLTRDAIPVKDGDVLAGKYRIESVLGAGGMGIVASATHVMLDQRVAIKFLLPKSLRNSQTVERFAREARAAVRLKSDHVARVLDVGTLETGSPFIVMEYLEGSDLDALLGARGPLPIGEAVSYVLQACDAVAEAHGLGIVHRDLKPHNLFITRRNDGQPLLKVLDFGISKMHTDGDLSLTRTTEVVGSPNYMSPEQLRSARAADPRSDIWSLGVILFELVAGTLPWLAETVTQLTAVVLQDPPRPLRELRPDAPPGLVAIVERCLEKDRERRFQSVAELAAALEPFAPHEARDLAARVGRIAARSGGSLVPPPTPSRINVSGGTSVAWSDPTALAPTAQRSRWAVGIAAVVGAAVIAAASLFFVTRMARVPAATPTAAAATPAPPSRSTSTSTSTPTATPPPTSSSTSTQAAGEAESAPGFATASSASAPSARPSGKNRQGGAPGPGPAKPKDELPQNRTSW